MTRKKLEGLKRELAEARRMPQNARKIRSIAKRLGRKLANRGKHPMWVSTEFAHLFPLSIPDHSGRDFAPKTRNSMVDQLEFDVLAWEAKLAREEAEQT